MNESMEHEDPHRLDEKLVEVYRAENVTEAQLIIHALEEQGIKAHIAGSNVAGGYAEVQGWHNMPQVLVFENDYQTARSYIMEREGARELRDDS